MVGSHQQQLCWPVRRFLHLLRAGATRIYRARCQTVLQVEMEAGPEDRPNGNTFCLLMRPADSSNSMRPEQVLAQVNRVRPYAVTVLREYNSRRHKSRCLVMWVINHIQHCLLQMETWAMSVERRSTELTRTNRSLRAASEQTKKVKGCGITIRLSINFDDGQRSNSRMPLASN